jgi:hypothetical protein
MAAEHSRRLEAWELGSHQTAPSVAAEWIGDTGRPPPARQLQSKPPDTPHGPFASSDQQTYCNNSRVIAARTARRQLPTGYCCSLGFPFTAATLFTTAMSEQLLEQVRDAVEGQIVRSFVTMHMHFFYVELTRAGL